MPYDFSSAERISGLVERVTFHSEESGFAVLRVKIQARRALVTVVGTLVDATAGEWLEASGHWVVDPQHGPQFKAESLRTTHPKTVEGIEKYLGSGSIKGIGPHFASRLVGAFGVDVFDVIEKEPDRLLEVKGIGPIRQEKITAAWEEQKAVREIMVFLHSQGVGTSRAFRIYKTYGEEAIEKVRENPYRLAQDIWGIGFKTADQVAKNLGIAKDSDIRARAGVQYVLQRLTEEGHCAYPKGELLDRASRMLEVPGDIVERAIVHEVQTGSLSVHEHDGDALVYLSTLDTSEQLLAENLVRLTRLSHPCPPIEVSKAISWAEERLSITLAPAQCEAIQKAVTSKVLIITGGPGVGKTTLIHCIVRIFKAKNLKVSLAAPTGRAAKRMSEATGMEAKTIHRLLEFDPATGRFKHNHRKPLKGDIFIVDETSMIDLVLAHQLVRAIPVHAALILVGDVDQLPSVGPGRVLQDIINSKMFPVCRLIQVFRQAAESDIITNAYRINAGELPRWPKVQRGETADARDFYFVECAEPEKAVQIMVHLLQDRIPKRFGFDPIEDVQVLTPMQRGDLGARNLNLVLQAALNPESEGVSRFGWKYCPGDRVMQIVNNYESDVFNGDMGRIDTINREEGEVIVLFDGRSVTYDLQELDELALAYAITIHKSQGSEYPCVVIPVHTQHYTLLQRNLLYTAVTRGRQLVVLVGTIRAMAIAVKRMEMGRRITTLTERLASGAAS